MPNTPKNHHYIPQFFLKYFSIVDEHGSNNLWSFDRATKNYKLRGVKNVAALNKFYTYLHDGKEENLEGVFSQAESLAKSVIDKVIKKESIDDQEKADLAMFLALLKVRVPDFKKWTEEGGEKMYKKVNKMTFSNRTQVESMIKRTGKELSKKEIDDLIEFAIDENRYDVKFPPNYWIKIMLSMSLELADLFIDSNWQFYYFDRQYALVTCDNPVVLVPPKEYSRFYGFGQATPGASKIISLTSNIALVIGDVSKNPTIAYLESTNKDLWRWINRITARNSDQFIYSPKYGKLEKLVKDTKVGAFMRKQRVVVG